MSDRIQSPMNAEEVYCVKKVLRGLTREDLLDYALGTSIAVQAYCYAFGNGDMLKTNAPLESIAEAERLKAVTLKVQTETVNLLTQRERRN